MFSDSLVIMKLQFICLLIALLILVSSCNTAPKTQPIIIEEGVEEEQKEEPEENDIVDVTGAIIVIGLYLLPRSFCIITAGLGFFISCPTVGSRLTNQISLLFTSTIFIIH